MTLEAHEKLLRDPMAIGKLTLYGRGNRRVMYSGYSVDDDLLRRKGFRGCGGSGL